MSSNIESSVAVSLGELMRAEQDRVHAEAEREQERRQQADRRERERAAAQMAEDEQRRRAQEVRRNDEIARLEAERRAELERARRDAEVVLAQPQPRLLEQTLRRQLRTLVGTLSAVIVLWALSVAVLVVWLDQTASRRLSALAAAQADAAQQWNQTCAGLDARVAETDGRLRLATLELRDRQSALDDAQDKLRRAEAALSKRGVSWVRPPHEPSGCDRAACRFEGDPLCGCLPR